MKPFSQWSQGDVDQHNERVARGRKPAQTELPGIVESAVETIEVRYDVALETFARLKAEGRHVCSWTVDHKRGRYLVAVERKGQAQ